jgi:hypothetical protein
MTSDKAAVIPEGRTSVIARMTTAIDDVVGRPASERRWDICVVALAITVLAFDSVWWPGRALAGSMAILVLLAPGVSRLVSPWAAVGLALTIAYIGRWAETDNHHLLIIAAVLLVALVARQPDRAELLARGARSLVAMAFGLALVAKFSSADFLNGEFGELWPATDRRLADLAERVGALEPGDLSANERSTELLVSQDRAPYVPVAGWFATIFTWWTVVIELVVTLGFAVGRRRKLAVVGDLALLTFLATTYSVVPVLGFAAILGTLGLAQSRHRPISAFYVLGLVAIPLQDAVAKVI